jgi:hypothetical protein
MDARLRIDINKCEFETKTVKYLGFIIEAGVGVKIDLKKIAAIREWATLTNVKEVKGFIGFANFYRSFIPEFSDITRPLTDLTKKEIQFHWNDKCEEAFEKLKNLLIIAPILAHFNPKREIIVEVNSLRYLVGVLLL